MKNTIHIHTEKVKFPTAPEFMVYFLKISTTRLTEGCILK